MKNSPSHTLRKQPKRNFLYLQLRSLSFIVIGASMLSACNDNETQNPTQSRIALQQELAWIEEQIPQLQERINALDFATGVSTLAAGLIREVVAGPENYNEVTQQLNKPLLEAQAERDETQRRLNGLKARRTQIFQQLGY